MLMFRFLGRVGLYVVSSYSFAINQKGKENKTFIELINAISDQRHISFIMVL
jgi:hypothetical protein